MPDFPTWRWVTAPVEVLAAPGSAVIITIIVFIILVAGAFADWGLRIALPGRHGDLGLRAQWLSRWSRRLLRVLAVRVAGLGLPPQCGLLVSNHLGYLDVLVLAAVQPCVFVAKAEVRHWPVLGVLAGALILAEPVTPAVFIALTLVGCGIWLANRPPS